MFEEHSQVTRFHRAFEVPIRKRGEERMDDTEQTLRRNLIAEELKELSEGLQTLHLALPGNEEEFVAFVEVADALADTLYVVAGTLVQGGYAFTFEDTTAALRTILADGFNEIMMGLQHSQACRVRKGAAMMEIGIKGFGTIVGIDVEAVFAEVHRSNMTKLGEDGKALFRTNDGKVLKGPNYEDPQLDALLRERYDNDYNSERTLFAERVRSVNGY